ncbi:MAG: hypothetical protein KBF76_18715 [Verrucomicrobiales bacterium]|nr:hypothetical protein [Verrucomicrobiales bacterium]
MKRFPVPGDSFVRTKPSQHPRDSIPLPLENSHHWNLRIFAHPAQGIFGYWIHAFREGCPLKYIGIDGLGHQVRDGFHPRDLLPLIEKQIAEPCGSPRSPFTNLGGGHANSAPLAELSAWCRTRFPT